MKTFRLLIAAAGIVSLSIISYYVIVVVMARDYTRDVIIKDLESKSWRRPNGSVNGFLLSAGDMTQRQLDILLAVEDPTFFEHNGMDLRTPGAGITTLTQGLVKILYFENFKPGIRKVKQTLIAVFALDPLISKEDQLLLSINALYLGHEDEKEIRGFEEAAQSYYGKSFESLTEDEYVSLVAMIIAPNSFHVLRHPEENAERVRRIKKLVAGEYKPSGLMDVYYEKH
ncbi:MAG: glycosyl transferase family 51 [Candidatus Abyssobacteria bacterium SURF_5]|uniref:Glycosyl transferase family 51 n=1 Tax=Abyssobacteria bacterium (strain SURF_5) TaxID=2093360 RepID=A0A3A4P1G2_ABYX5|nr:MAG: glycosyl transferase family 51 [Candidatus Abyssubacteria bacterium SURF_5]